MTAKSRPPVPKELQLSLFRRDRWICRWCNRPVIFTPVMKLLAREVRNSGRSAPLSYYHAHWTRDGAPLLDELGAVIDHVEAFSTGGANSEENLATACNKCNGRKSSAPVDKFSKRIMRKPVKGKYGEPQHWDGLSGVFVILAQRDQGGLTVSDKAWLRCWEIKTRPDHASQSKSVYFSRRRPIAEGLERLVRPVADGWPRSRIEMEAA